MEIEILCFTFIYVIYDSRVEQLCFTVLRVRFRKFNKYYVKVKK